MLDGNWRAAVDRGLTPIGRSLRRTGISADAVTTTGIVMASAAAVSIGLGYLRFGLLFLVLTGIPDALDGAVAKASGTSSKRGAFFDSVPTGSPTPCCSAASPGTLPGPSPAAP